MDNMSVRIRKWCLFSIIQLFPCLDVIINYCCNTHIHTIDSPKPNVKTLPRVPSMESNEFVFVSPDSFPPRLNKQKRVPYPT